MDDQKTVPEQSLKSEAKMDQHLEMSQHGKLDSMVEQMYESFTKGSGTPDSATFTEEIPVSVHNEETLYAIHDEDTNNLIKEYITHSDYEPFDNIQTVPDSPVNQEQNLHIDQQSHIEDTEHSSTEYYSEKSELKHQSDSYGFKSADSKIRYGSPSNNDLTIHNTPPVKMIVKTETNFSKSYQSPSPQLNVSQIDKKPDSNAFLHLDLVKEQSELEILRSFVASLKQEKEKATQQVQDLKFQVRFDLTTDQLTIQQLDNKTKT